MHVAAVDAPSADEYLPAPQLTHVEDVDCIVPVEYVPALQSVHASLPRVGLYFPSTQKAQGPPPGPEAP